MEFTIYRRTLSFGGLFDPQRMCRANGPAAGARKTAGLWIHQMESLKSLAQLRAQGHPSAYLEIGTGGGKTLIAAQDALSFIQQSRGTRVLWIAHRAELLDQAEEAFRELAPEVRISRNKSNLYECDVLIISKQTLENRLSQFPRAAFQYVVVDEAHHAYAEGYQTILQHLVPRFKLGITATPRRFSDRKHIRDIFGSCALKMNLLELVRAGILIEKIGFRKIETNVEVEARLADSGEFNLPHFWSQIKDTARNEVVANTYLELEEGKRNRPALTFCVSVEHAQAMAELYKQKGIKAEALHGKLSKEERSRVLRDFESGALSMITCVDILNEGYDFPPIEVILMARPTRSKTVWLQQVGRGTRKSPATGKKDLLIIDFVDNLGAFQKQITFEEIFKSRRIGAPISIGASTEKEAREDVYIEDIIEMDLNEIFGVIPLQFHELTTHMLAKRVGVTAGTIIYYINNGRIIDFVKRKIVLHGHEASIFKEEDVEKIKEILNTDQLPLQPHELTTTMLANSVGVAAATISCAIKDGRITDFVKRKIILRGPETSVFKEVDVEKIKTILNLDQPSVQSHELTAMMLVNSVGVAAATIHRAIKDGRITDFVKRKIILHGHEASIFDKKDIGEIKAILHADRFHLRAYELTTHMLADRIGVSVSAIQKAIRNGRITAFIKRKIMRAGKEAPVFAGEDVEKIKTIFNLDRRPLQSHELTTHMLANRIGASVSTIKKAIRDGRITAFIKRKIVYGGNEASVFEEEDVEKIKRKLGR